MFSLTVEFSMNTSCGTYPIEPGHFLIASTGVRPEIDIDPVGFESESYVWGIAWEAWPEAAKIRFRNYEFPFTEINGVRIGDDNLKGFLLRNGEPVSEEAREIDEKLGYYVPFEVMMKGDQAVYDHIKTEIDDQFPGERP